MFKKLFGNKLSEEESRTIKLAITSIGCIFLMILAKRIEKTQIYFLTEFFIENDAASSPSDATHNLTSNMAIADKIQHWSEVLSFIHRGSLLSNRVKKEIVLVWITFLSITYTVDDRALRLIGHFCRELDLSSKHISHLFKAAEEIATSGYYSVMANSEGLDECQRRIHDSINRLDLNLDEV